MWRKKIEKSLLDGVDAKDLGLKAEKAKHEQRLLEIEKVKQQREQREKEKMEKEQEREIREREEALIEAVELEKKEEEFHVQQAKMRSDIRVKEGRARAVDLVARNVECEVGVEASVNYDFNLDPFTVFHGLTTQELYELKDDLLVRLDLTKNDAEKQTFWRDFLVITDDELGNARRRDAVDRARVRGGDSIAASNNARDTIDQGLHEQVEKDVAEMLAGKSRLELEGLEREVCDTLGDPDSPELEYWQAVLRRISVSKARAAIQDQDVRMKQKHEAHRPRDVPKAHDDGNDDDDSDEDLLGADFGVAAAQGAVPGDGDEAGDEPPSPNAQSLSGGLTPEGTPDREYSPVLLDAKTVPEYLIVLDPEEDAIATIALRNKARRAKMGLFVEAGMGRMDGGEVGEGAVGGAVGHTPIDNDEFASKAKTLSEKMMGANDGAEVQFSGEQQLESTAYWWHDKFRPRKPKYFNRVHTGYDWNKYNQTHYDHDNPPPKTVQGYKFNLFYPDLIDKSKAPAFSIMPDGSKHGETCILRVSAGPPYEGTCVTAFPNPGRLSLCSHTRPAKGALPPRIVRPYLLFATYITSALFAHTWHLYTQD